ncbi:MAG: response regulator [Alphaproteobacteria bacterium]|nr:MAG: response regulator [Alphaproteobacteria bacterium]
MNITQPSNSPKLSSTPTSAKDNSSHTPHILIIEDNELNLKLFNDLLEAHGYGTLHTRSGMEGIRLARRHHPDLILMDIQLPEVSGLELIGMIKADASIKHIPVITVTAFAMKGDEERARSAGCDGYMSKPISIKHFIGTIDEFLGQKRPQPI